MANGDKAVKANIPDSRTPQPVSGDTVDIPINSPCYQWYQLEGSFIDFSILIVHFICSFDYLNITNENNQDFGKYCGSQAGLHVVVTGIEAVITFHSDSSVTRRGYKLTFNVFCKYMPSHSE